jgi:hypothetical protein
VSFLQAPIELCFPSSAVAAFIYYLSPHRSFLFIYYLSPHRSFLFLAAVLLKVQGWTSGRCLALWCDIKMYIIINTRIATFQVTGQSVK